MIINFGKYAGTELAECPKNYLFWLCNQNPDVNRDGVNWSVQARKMLSLKERINFESKIYYKIFTLVGNAVVGKVTVKTGRSGEEATVSWEGRQTKSSYYELLKTFEGENAQSNALEFLETKINKVGAIEIALRKGDKEKAAGLIQEFKDK